MDGRHELKFHINAADAAVLRTRLRAVARPDRNAGADGEYIVRSLYFDNYSDKAVFEKLSGLSRREKFRLRYYNGDTSFIRIERKSKANRLAYKEDAQITAERCEALLSGEFECLREPGEPLMMELYTKIRYQNLRPKNIVDYWREAYTYPAGHVRVTLDSGIRTTNSVAGFLSPQIATTPAAGAIVLEIKYDGFLPDVIRDILQIGHRNQTEFSKYVAARFV
jgi:hypothetical protein